MMMFRRLKIVLLLLFLSPFFLAFLPQEARVNRKKIEREQEKKHKEAQRKYDKAVKRHQQSQSKETRARMKQTKKDSKKVTPLRH
jgi:hypothetical protein